MIGLFSEHMDIDPAEDTAPASVTMPAEGTAPASITELAEDTPPALATQPEIEQEEKKETVVGSYKIDAVLSQIY